MTLGFGTSDDVAGLIAFLASDAAAGVTGQAIGIGGDRIQLWSHPKPFATEYRDGGWTYDALVDVFGWRSATCSRSARSFPELPPNCSAPPRPPSRGDRHDPLRIAIDLEALTAIDMHVHLEVDDHGTTPLPDDLVEAASPYFTPTDRAPTRPHRRRTTASGRWRPSCSPSTRSTASRHRSIIERRDRRGRGATQRRADPLRLRGPAGLRGDRPTRAGWSTTAECGGSSSTRPCRVSTPRRDALPALRRLEEPASSPCSTRARPASAPGCPAGAACGCGLLEPDPARPRRGGLPGPADHHGASLGPVAGGGALGCDAQAQHLDRPVGLEPQVLPRRARPLRQLDPEAPGALRFGLPAAHPRSVDRAMPSRPR